MLFRQYEAIPDLWAELQQSRQLLSAPSDDTPFSEAEQAEISRGMQQVRTFITAVPELTADQLTEVNNRLDEMEEASRRPGRKDWLMLFNGVVFSLILTDTITPRSRSASSCWAYRAWATCSASGVPRRRCRRKT